MDSQTKRISNLNKILTIAMTFILFMFFVAVVFAHLPAVSPITCEKCERSSAFATWLSLLPSIVSAAATVFYACIFFRLQKEINDFNKNISRDNRLIEMSTQWNSLDFVRARNLTYLIINNYKDDKSKLYDQFSNIDDLDKWVSISLIAHFIERLGRLLVDKQIDIERTSAEFGENIDWWCELIIPVFENRDTEKGLVNAMKKAQILLGKSRGNPTLTVAEV